MVVIMATKNKISPLRRACAKNKVSFKHKFSISPQENCDLILHSYFAPTIVGKWQDEEGYIPCRAFKNASYGQYLVTNSKTVYNLFGGRGVYNKDTQELFYDAEKKIKNLTLGELLELMTLLKQSIHTLTA